MISDLLHPHTLLVHQVSDGPLNAAREVTRITSDREWGPCNVQQTASTETRTSGESTVTRFRASGPLAQWISSGDRVTWLGESYAIDGKPAHFSGGSLNHTEAVLIEWKGR